MKAKLIPILFLFISIYYNISASGKSPNEIPYFMIRYSELYHQSPREAGLAWFDEARMGLFIHWGV